MTRLALASALLTVLAACGPGGPPDAAEAPPVYAAAGASAASFAVAPDSTAPASATPFAEAPSAAPALLPADPNQAAVAALEAPLGAGNYANGQRTYNQCRSCHLIEAGGGSRVGPNLHGIFGRKAGEAEGFAYSPAMKDSGVTWTAAELDKFLADPRAAMPGNRMTYLGIRDADDRRDVIAYIAVESKK